MFVSEIVVGVDSIRKWHFLYDISLLEGFPFKLIKQWLLENRDSTCNVVFFQNKDFHSTPRQKVSF